MNTLEERQLLAKCILEHALGEIALLEIAACIRDGAYEPDGMPIDIDNVDFENRPKRPKC